MGVDELLKLVGRIIDHDVAIEDPERVAESMARAFRAEINSDRSISGAGLGRLLNISKQAVQQRAARGTLLVVADEDGVRYPTWQIVDGRPVPGLARLIHQARRQGISDTALASWVEQDPSRLPRLQAGQVQTLFGELPHRKAPVKRRRASGPVPTISD